MKSTAPKVFISYSHDSAEHVDRVLDLADGLRNDGIDAEIDQYNSSPPEGWRLWCERQIEAADFVLMVCTETYHRRVRGEEQPGTGLGVVWEAAIIRQLLYDAGEVSNKFIPVLFSHSSAANIPTPIRGRTRYVVDKNGGYEDLYRLLSEQPDVARPPLGTLRPLPARARKVSAADLSGAPDATAPSEPVPSAERTVAASGAGSVAIGGGARGANIVTGNNNTVENGQRRRNR